jgi:hypothetical protein
MARTYTKAEFKYTAPVKVSRARFELSTAFANVDVGTTPLGYALCGAGIVTV